jgi:hypothetical protein
MPRMLAAAGVAGIMMVAMTVIGRRKAGGTAMDRPKDRPMRTGRHRMPTAMDLQLHLPRRAIIGVMARQLVTMVTGTAIKGL